MTKPLDKPTQIKAGQIRIEKGNGQTAIAELITEPLLGSVVKYERFANAVQGTISWLNYLLKIVSDAPCLANFDDYRGLVGIIAIHYEVGIGGPSQRLVNSPSMVLGRGS